jgi:hypothetical protein
MIEVEFDAQAVQDALLGQADALRGALEARIQQKLSGGVLQTRSGALAASIISSIENDGSHTSVSISSTGVPYAAIQEFGGKTAAHDIVAVTAKVLEFSADGSQVFARSVPRLDNSRALLSRQLSRGPAGRHRVRLQTSYP